MDSYPIVVECPSYRWKNHKRKMASYGLRWDGNDSFIGQIKKRKYSSLSYYCEIHHLKMYINNSYGIRSTDYRRKFFDANPPVFWNMYFCAYCGRIRSRRYITVDHLYPIGNARKSPKLQKKLARMGIQNINDAANLVPACARCNKQKGTKMGLWILRGRIGKHPKVWIFRHMIRILICLIIIGLFIYNRENNGIVISCIKDAVNRILPAILALLKPNR